MSDMSEAPLISIIIPVYNVERHLKRCLDSISTQSNHDWEAILVDDGSTDSSGSICDEYAARDTRFRVFHKPNGGVSTARNLGIDNARGQWIWFVDSDDWIAENALSIIADSTVKEESEGTPLCIHWNFRCIHDNKLNTYVCPDTITTRDITTDALFTQYNPSMVFGFLFHTSIIKKFNIQFTPGVKCGEDVEFIIRYMTQISSVRHIVAELYNYYINPDSFMHRNPDYLLMASDITGVLERIILLWKNGGSSYQDWMTKQFDKRYISIMVYLLYANPTSHILKIFNTRLRRLAHNARRYGLKPHKAILLSFIPLRISLLILRIKISQTKPTTSN